jgi:hypothetical protein
MRVEIRVWELTISPCCFHHMLLVGGVCDQKTSKFFVSHVKNPCQDTLVEVDFIKS